MKENFVPYEIALLAKQKDFNERCFNYYKENGELHEIDLYYPKMMVRTECVAPLYQQLIDWLFEEYNMHISYWCVFAIPDWWDYRITSQECLNSAIIKALNLL